MIRIFFNGNLRTASVEVALKLKQNYSTFVISAEMNLKTTF